MTVRRLLLVLTVCILTTACDRKNQEVAENSGAAQSSKSSASALVIRLEGGDWGYPSPFAHYPRGPGGFKMALIFESLLERVPAILACTGLDHKWLAAYPHQISGGMRQRVLIAMALVCEPELLIVDEPTNSLDPDSREAIFDLLESLKNSLGFSMILISHNLQAVRGLPSGF